MIEASGEEGDSDDEKETKPQAAAECPAHKTIIKIAKEQIKKFTLMPWGSS